MTKGALAPGRPLLRYHGGKWMAAPWIIGHFPPHRVYVEPFGGGASVLLRKPRVGAEIYNDLDGEIVSLFRVVRERGPELARLLELTPYARGEFDLSFTRVECPLEQARRTLIRAAMGYGSTVTRPTRQDRPMRTGFRTYSGKERGATPARDWLGVPANVEAVTARFRGVVIEQRDARKCMAEHDGVHTLHYVDPPYVLSTRTPEAGGSHRGYRFELQDADHEALAESLHGLAGAVVLSGYASPLYDRLFSGWERVEAKARADGARARREVLWLRNIDPSLFRLL